MDYKGLKITKHLQSGFRIEWGTDPVRVAYIDPFKLSDDLPKADVIFVTHEHFDHCDMESIKKVMKSDTAVFGNAAVRNALESLNIYDFREVIASELNMPAIDVLQVEVVPAFNTNKFREGTEVFHPEESHGVGYILNFAMPSETVSVYHMGDTDFNREIHLPQIDVLLIPVSGVYVMTADEAVVASNSIRPDIAIPMHYDAGVVGSINDAEKLKMTANCRVEILTAE